MKKIQFVSKVGQDVVFVPDLGGATAFENGEIREVSDEDAALLLSNPNFVEAGSSKNPNYVCPTCGGYRDDSAIVQKGLVRHDECVVCRDKASAVAPAPVVSSTDGNVQSDSSAVPAVPEPQLDGSAQ